MSKAAELAALIGSQTALSNRNLIINGAMQVNQRQTTFTGANATSGYIVDRFSWSTNNTGSFDVSSSTTSPVGFSNSIGISCTTAEASPTAGSYQNVIHRLEAQSIQQLNASSGTVAFTISFYVYSSKTGTYTIEARKMDSARHIAQEFTISSANTWERKTISIPADATGSINNDNGSGIQLYFWLAGGTTYTSGTLATSWGAFDNANRVSSNNVNIGDSTSNTFYITGVQLELGEQATPFEHRSYGDELQRCQRYLQVFVPDGQDYCSFASAIGTSETNRFFCPITLSGAGMRTDPTLSFSSVGDFRTTNVFTNNHACTNISMGYNNPKIPTLSVYSGGSGDSVSRMFGFGANTSAYMRFDAEL